MVAGVLERGRLGSVVWQGALRALTSAESVFGRETRHSLTFGRVLRSEGFPLSKARCKGAADGQLSFNTTKQPPNHGKCGKTERF